MAHRLRALKDSELLTALFTIVQRSNTLTAELVEHLAELDQRRLHLDLGYPSLFAYCVQSLGLCEATAGRRIAVARVCQKHPEARARIASGTLHVSALCLLKQYLTPENAMELFELCSRKSARQVEALLAARFPRPDAPDSIRRLPARLGSTLNGESALVNHAAALGSGSAAASGSAPASGSEAQVKTPGQVSAAPRFAAQRLEPLSVDRFLVRFTANTEFRELLERVRGLAGHRLPSGDLLTLLKRGLLAYERELKKERFSVGREPRTPRRAAAQANTSATRKRPRAAVVREVYARDQGRCTFTSSDGRRCSACQLLELDHVIPWAVGGDDTPQNLRLRCRAHNLHYAEQCFGTAHVRSAMTSARRREEHVEP